METMPEISDEGLEETKSDNDEASDSDRALVDIIKRFTSSIYIEPDCTCVRPIVLFSSIFVITNKFIQRLALFH